jgi:hypothetical protein
MPSFFYYRYYDNSEAKMFRELNGIATRGGKMIVAGRYDGSAATIVAQTFQN